MDQKRMLPQNGRSPKIRTSKSHLIPFNEVRKKRLACEPQCISDGLKDRPLMVCSQNTIPVQNGQLFHSCRPLELPSRRFAGCIAFGHLPPHPPAPPRLTPPAPSSASTRFS